MPCEVLVSTSSGRIIHAKAPGGAWGGEEYNVDKFVRAKISDMSVDEALEYSKSWRRWTTYEVVSFDPMQDLFEVRMFARSDTVAKDTGEGRLSVREVREFLDWWGATTLPETSDDNILFRLSASDVLNGKGFIYFGDEDEFVIFNELSYDPASGLHVIRMDYSLSSLKWAQGLNKYMESRVTVLSVDDDAGLLTFEVTRDQLVAALEESVRQNFNIEISSFRYALEASVISTIKAAGGFLEMEKKDFTLVDRLEA